MSKIVLVGANHAGTAAANTILGKYPDEELVIFDSNSNISYLGCGTALWLGRQIKGTDGLFYCTPDVLKKKGANIHIETVVEDIDFESKTVTAHTKGGKQITESFDKLIIATGSLPIIPKIPGSDLENVSSVKLFQDGQAIDKALEKKSIQRVAVVGAGYIGVEIAESMKRRGKEVLLFEAEKTSLSGYYDKDFSKEMDKNLKENGIELHFGERITELTGEQKVTGVKTNKGEYQVDFVVLSIGFKPNSSFGGDRLERFGNGAYMVDLRQRTSLPNVYAIGDCATVYNNAKDSVDYIALASNAVRSGIIAAHNACGNKMESAGVQGSNGISIFGYKMVSTGLSVESAKNFGFEAEYTDYEDLQKPAFIEEVNEKVKIRIVYDKFTRRILGAQMASRQDISMAVHMFSLAIQERVTIDKLSLLDIFFLPHFNQPYNYISMAAMGAEQD